MRTNGLFNHTAGPWKIDQTIGEHPAVVSVAPMTHAIATSGFKGKQAWANAKLISKAPEMLDVLLDLMSHVAYEEANDGRDIEDGDCYVNTLYRKADKLIEDIRDE